MRIKGKSTRKFRVLLRLWLCAACFIGLMASLEGQNNFEKFLPYSGTYKKLQKQSRELDVPIFAVLFSEDYFTSSDLILNPADDLGFVIDSTIATVIDWSRKANHKLVKRENVVTNPYYLMTHHNGTVLARSQGIKDVAALRSFISNGQALYYRLNALLNSLEQNKKDEEIKKQVISFYNKIGDVPGVEKNVEEYLKSKKNQIGTEDLKYLFSVGKACYCSEKLNELFSQNRAAMMDFVSEEDWVDYRQGYIISDLNKRDLLNPPNVWTLYEGEFGAKADSLYRLFAISYFKLIEPDREILLDEIYEFLYYYKDAPWGIQDDLFNQAIEYTTKADDWELLLDMISYHVYKNKTYRNLDFRAMVLYKMGKEEQAIGLMEEVAALALEKGLKYKSMLYALRTVED